MLESEDWKRPDSASITICVMDSVYDDFDVIKYLRPGKWSKNVLTIIYLNLLMENEIVQF